MSKLKGEYAKRSLNVVTFPITPNRAIYVKLRIRTNSLSECDGIVKAHLTLQSLSGGSAHLQDGWLDELNLCGDLVMRDPGAQLGQPEKQLPFCQTSSSDPKDLS